MHEQEANKIFLKMLTLNANVKNDTLHF